MYMLPRVLRKTKVPIFHTLFHFRGLSRVKTQLLKYLTFGTKFKGRSRPRKFALNQNYAKSVISRKSYTVNNVRVFVQILAERKANRPVLAQNAALLISHVANDENKTHANL